MKATTTIMICLVIFLIFGFSAQAQEIPGGIVYSDGKDAVYYDYKTGQTINLTADLKGPAIKGSLAASEDGKLLIWREGNNFLIRRLPDAKPSVALPDKLQIGGPRWFYQGKSQIQGNIENLTLSPEGDHLAFDFTEKNNYWVLTSPANDPNYPRRGPGSFGGYPKYEARTGQEYNATMLISTATGSGERYGNSGFYPPTFPFRGTYENIGPNQAQRAKDARVTEGPLMTSSTIPDIKPGLIVPIEDAHKKFSIKRDARFLTWQKASNWGQEQQFLALIYKTDKGWGPIEIRDIGIKTISKNPKPDVYEIPVSLNDFQGLAWRPDGSLTYLSDKKVFLLNADKILEGIKNSGVAKYNEPNNRIPKLIPTKNVFTIDSELVAEGIDGDRLHWVTNDTFLFRGKEGSLKNICFWHQGKIEKLCSSPGEFSYCDQPPFGLNSVVSGKNSVFEREFFIGSIKVVWAGNNKYFLYVHVGKLHKQAGKKQIEYQKALEYTFPTETNLKDIKNPSKYNYLTKDADTMIVVPVNRIIVLKLDNKYAAIKPLTAREAYIGAPNSQDPWMTYEWKYWSESTKFGDNERNANEISDKSLRPTLGGKETSVGMAVGKNNLVMGEITAGNIKITWQRYGTDSSPEIWFASAKQQNETRAGYIFLPIAWDLETITDPSKYPYYYEGATIIPMKGVVVFKSGDKYVAIKPIEFKRQGANGSLVYKWKYWPETTNGKKEPSQLKIATKELFQVEELKTTKKERISFTSPEANLLVGDVKTVWGLRNQFPFLIVNSRQTETRDMECSFAPKGIDIEKINPSDYSYKKVSDFPVPPQFNAIEGIVVGLNQLFLLKLGNSYAAIKPLEIGPNGTWIDFEWKSWSATDDKVATKTP